METWPRRWSWQQLRYKRTRHQISGFRNGLTAWFYGAAIRVSTRGYKGFYSILWASEPHRVGSTYTGNAVVHLFEMLRHTFRKSSMIELLGGLYTCSVSTHGKLS